ncbi:MAG: CBS domain-containing protein [Actinobacteria bacterium]|nr:CBS domain-containing protein [Actinomycetota bacterium]
MEIGPFVTRSVLTVEEGESLRDAATSMIERGVGSAVVLTDGKPSGIVTDREALHAIAQGKDATSSTVAEFVKGKLATVVPSLDIFEAARVMRQKGFRHLVVVDDQGELMGVFSMRDLVVGLMEERASLLVDAEGAEGTS